MEVEKIGVLIRESGFTVDEKALAETTAVLEKLGDFITLEPKGGITSSEDQIAALRRSGVISEKDAKKFMATVKEQREGEGGIKYAVEDVEAIIGAIDAEEDKKANKIRGAITVQRNAVRNVLKLLKELESKE